ncbi:MAG: carbohydrate kinase family protein [Bacillota bacterium]
MDYVIVSTLVTDDITLHSGEHIGFRLGGAGTYAFCGIRLWTDSAMLVTGVGEDFQELYGSWFLQNQCSMAGITVKDERTAISEVRYRENAERTEIPRYGYEHYLKLEATPREIEKHCAGARGVYVFKDLAPGYWEQILSLKAQYGFALLWEINADAASPQYCDRVRALAEQCDVFSINRTEARAMLSVQDAEEQSLAGWRVPMVYLRAGRSGAYVIRSGEIHRIPAVKDVQALDPTGAGNASSAAVLYGYSEGYGAKACGAMGSISGALALEQYGPPPFGAAARSRALELREKMCREMMA